MDLMRSSLLFETVYRDDSGDVFCLQKQFFFESRVSVFYYVTEYTAKYKLSFWTLMPYLLEGKTRKRTWFESEKLKDTSFSLEVTVSTSTQEIYGVRL